MIAIQMEHTFKEGAKTKALYITNSISKETAPFKLGYYLWGMDIWIGNIPLIKMVILINVINIAILWIVK
jgi:hypothetical protein